MNIYEFLKELFLEDTFLREKVGERIFYYVLSEQDEENIDGPFVIIDVIDPKQPTFFVSNRPMAYKSVFQIDVQGEDSDLVEEIAERIVQILFKKKFYTLPGALNTFFDATQRYLLARKFEGITPIYEEEK